MQEHQKRVVDERAELNEKVQKLAAFTNGPIFPALPEAERTRLYRQLDVMAEYRNILDERIAAF